MKNIFKTISALAAAGTLAVTGTSFAAPAGTPVNLKAAAADDNNDDWLHAEGSRLYDMNGNQVWLTGANWFGMNCTENVPHGLYARDVDDMLSTIAQISDTENPTIFPFPFAMHITLAVISVIFFTYRFMVQKKPFQLIFAVAVPLSLLLWVSKLFKTMEISSATNKKIFYAVGAIELVLILLAFITSIVCKPKKEEAAAAAADVKADTDKDDEEDDEDGEE